MRGKPFQTIHQRPASSSQWCSPSSESGSK